MGFRCVMKRVLAAGVAAWLATSAHADVVNGGFETGDFTGWSVGGDTTFSGVAAGIQHSGDAAAFFGPDPFGTLAQDIATVAGEKYALTFWLALDDSAAPNRFSWALDGVMQGLIDDGSLFDYTRFETFFVAADSSTTLEFFFSNPASFWRLDDVGVKLPEPATPLLALTALALLGAIRLRRHPR